MRKWEPDQLDLWCGQWARQRRKVRGISGAALEPRERLGALSCTLGRVRDECEGASQNRIVDDNGRFPQRFPEVYVGMALEIHRGFCSMNEPWRVVMEVHYVFAGVSPKQKILALGMKNADYWATLSRLKIYLSGSLGLNPDELRSASKKTSRKVENTSALLQLTA